MPNSVHFVNCLANTISVNLNSALENVKLDEFDPRVVSEKGRISVFSGRAATFEIGPNVGKAVFGSGAKNLVQVFSSQLAGSPIYDVAVSESGLDYFFYVFADTMVGQKSTGNTDGVVISRVEIKRVKLQ
jgi:hypothetical protein